ncbi:MAG: MarR family transcriptional regulator [Caulobacteraceae bacterium]
MADNADGGPTALFVDYWLQQRQDLDPQVLALELTLARLNLLSKRSATWVAEAHGVTATDYSLMAVIKRGKDGKPIGPSDLAKLFNLRPSVITYRVNQLVERGLVRRADKPGDRRAILLHLTDKGAVMVDAILGSLANHLSNGLDALDGLPGGRDGFLDLLSALVRRLEQLETAANPPS